MTMTLTLEMLADGLREPFAVEDVKFLPKSPIQTKGEWKCLALPYADKRAYEDRLNDLAFGHWSTPPTTPLVAGNKLVIPVTIVLCGVAHTDYGEAFLSSLNRNGNVREEDNSATVAYSQAFRRACAQFRLGRYLYQLSKVWVPYNPEKRAIVLSGEEKRRFTEQLYREAGLLPALPTSSSSPVSHRQGKERVTSASTNASPQAHPEGLTEQQMTKIRQLCQALGKVAPEPSTLSCEKANTLIERLNQAYRSRTSASQKTAPVQNSEARDEMQQVQIPAQNGRAS